jgi:hypothetical protein
MLVSEAFIMCGFRYALGRRTYIVGEVCRNLVLVWEDLSELTRKQIKAEIREAIDRGHAGLDCDVEDWKKILDLPTNS